MSLFIDIEKNTFKNMYFQLTFWLVPVTGTWSASHAIMTTTEIQSLQLLSKHLLYSNK